MLFLSYTEWVRLYTALEMEKTPLFGEALMLGVSSEKFAVLCGEDYMAFERFVFPGANAKVFA